MTPGSFIERHTPKGEEFTLPKPKPKPAPPPVQFVELCELAQEFTAWCEALTSPILAKPDEVSVHVGLLRLQDGFMSRFSAAPVAHKRFSTRQDRHACLLDTYLAWYAVLDSLRRKMNPPLLREPPPRPVSEPGQPPEPPFQGIYLGEDMGRAFG